MTRAAAPKPARPARRRVVDDPPAVPAFERDNPDEAIGWVIGNRLRERRQELGLTLIEVANRAGVSKAMLSKLENAQVSPSLTTLASLGRALSVPVTAFFRGLDESHDAVFVQAGNGALLSRGGPRSKSRYEHLGILPGRVQALEPVLAELHDPSEVLPLFQHAGVEFIHVLSGAMEYSCGERRYTMRPGDSLQFDGEVTHGPTKLITLPVRFLVIKAVGTAPGSPVPVH
jgi:transcriptional regulator with XRE-family HTH domain